ncbi:MAG: hypothetical protein IJ509_03040 [Bacilli bacterium]|nr:hypothetical protein [Bacilli bacterium]
MKYAYLSLGFILFGMLGFILIVMFQDITVNNESEYYVLKEAMEAAMLESVDLVCYRIGDSEGKAEVFNNEGTIETVEACGDDDLKIIEQKFVENFTRRFAASVMGDVSEYNIQFYDIIEMPPKATVVITGKTQDYVLTTSGDESSFNLVNNLSGILELRN